MEEIDLKELFLFVKAKLGLLIAITAGVCILGCIYGLVLQKPMYQSYTTVILSGSDTTINQTDITMNKNLVNTYAQIVKSRRVLSKVINELDLDISYEGLAAKISVAAVNNTEIIKITVNDENAIQAKNIANVIAVYFTEEVEDLMGINNVKILDEAIESKSPYNINVAKQIIIYLMLGLVLACGILFVIYYFDRTVKSIEQVEQKIKLPILGGVEEYVKGAKK